ncbi:MAG: hypothetical protein KZQ83_14895 [gamma proteobacterium symbiont of Taylorina sp.]|nr:hypothetical protein [gamma proteobacterium symbiont of Taylorina sp.]
MQDQINKLNWEVELLKESHKNFKTEQTAINKKLSTITKVIFQLKWLVIGALSYAVLTEFGVISAIKTIVSLG